jgi:hydrogenase/urease accessory protein HupE
MTSTTKATLIFYIISFIIALWAGFEFGFTNSHTPPMTLLIELFVLLMGIILFAIGKKRKANYLVHAIGLAINSILVIYILKLAFSH